MISVIIPAKNEPHLQRTVDDLFAHAETDIEVIVGLDGWKPEKLTAPHLNRFLAIYEEESIGQRAMMNLCAQAASGHYIMKTDAHCSFGPGWDTIMLKDIDERTILAPYLLVLDAEHWTVRPDKRTSSYVFDTNLVMHYGTENKELVNETMCLQGSCFMVSKKTYWDWNLCDESLGSWGGQGTELGIKAFLNGGVCKTTKKTYYGHLFRHSEEEFPYKRDLGAINRSQRALIEKYKNKKLAKLIRKWNYPVDWTEEAVVGLRNVV